MQRTHTHTHTHTPLNSRPAHTGLRGRRSQALGQGLQQPPDEKTIMMQVQHPGRRLIVGPGASQAPQGSRRFSDKNFTTECCRKYGRRHITGHRGCCQHASRSTRCCFQSRSGDVGRDSRCGAIIDRGSSRGPILASCIKPLIAPIPVIAAAHNADGCHRCWRRWRTPK